MSTSDTDWYREHPAAQGSRFQSHRGALIAQLVKDTNNPLSLSDRPNPLRRNCDTWQLRVRQCSLYDGSVTPARRDRGAGPKTAPTMNDPGSLPHHAQTKNYHSTTFQTPEAGHGQEKTCETPCLAPSSNNFLLVNQRATQQLFTPGKNATQQLFTPTQNAIPTTFTANRQLLAIAHAHAGLSPAAPPVV